MKRKLKLKKLITAPLKWLKPLQAFLLKNKSTIELIVAVAALILAIDASRLSRQALKDSEENSLRADSMFTVQLQLAEELNNRIVNNLNDIQQLTGKQLEVTNQQLEISNQSLSDQKIEGRPVMVVAEKYINSGHNVVDCVFQNRGKRFANNIEIRRFIVTKDFQKVYDLEFKHFNLLGINDFERMRTQTPIRMPAYFISEIKYCDKFTGKKYRTTNFYDCNDNFETCDKETEEKLADIINEQMKFSTGSKISPITN